MGSYAGFARKALKTLDGIQLLAKNDAWEEAQVLARVIFELRATFDCFWKMLADDPKDACRRVIDAMMLEKMKQINSYKSDRFQSAIDRAGWDSVSAQIVARYPENELEALKKHGFTGVSIERRCQIAGYSHVYQVMYRNLSRNVHATDFTEQLGELVLDESYFNDFRRIRNCSVLSLGNWSAGGIIICADIDHICESELKTIQERSRA